jgi:hypothetical protein
MSRTDTTTIRPATKPMIGAAQNSTKPDGAVMATSAAIAPLPIMPTSRLLVSTLAAIAAPTTPAAAARFVTTTTSAKRLPSVPSVEPGLKPNQPSQRISTPMPNSGIEWPGIARGRPPASYLPSRGPSSSSAARPPVAPVRCTTVEPAKSCMPAPTWSRSPPPKIQCATSG